MKKNYMKLGLFVALMLTVECVSAQSAAQSTSPLASGSKPESTMINETQIPEKIDLPGYPVFVQTGNTDQDRARYDKECKQWISDNQEVYDAYMANQRAAVDKPVKSSNVLINELPGFPVMKRTGNHEMDLQNYNAEKMKFYEENRDLINAINEENARLNPEKRETKN